MNRVGHIRNTIDGLSAIERPAAALVALSRFTFGFGIGHSELSRFIDHLWGVVHVTPETWVSWADAFDHMAVLKPLEEYPAELIKTIPAGMARDFSALVRAVFQTSEATWYCSNPEGTRDALLKVIELLEKHRVPVPDLTAFRLSPDNSGVSWGPKPSAEILALWKEMALPNATMEPTR